MSTDVLIAFDTTGSMSSCLREVRRKVHDATKKLFESIPELRIGLIAFGDYCDSPNDFFKLDFTTDQDKLAEFVNGNNDTGGGDSDEYYEYVLHRAQEFSWQGDNKVFMLIADALPHKPGYKYGRVTFYWDWKEEAQKLADLGVSVYSVEALGERNSREFYEPLASYGNGRKVSLSQFSEVVETITAICYHKTGNLEAYKVELETGLKLNRNLAKLFQDLDKSIVVKETYTKTDSSGLIPVSPYRFQVISVDYECDIKSFVEKNKLRFRKGKGFYQFTKSELIQEHKEVILRNKVTGDMFTGNEARNFIGLPYGNRGTIRPHYFDQYEVYVQSTSSNRKLVGRTKFLYELEEERY